jgi:hypothetical protein
MIERRNRRRGALGKGSKVHNLFQGHAYCSCGRLLTFQAARSRKGEVRYGYLWCLGKRDGLCDQPNIKYDEELILRGLMSQKWHLFFKATDRRNEVRAIRQAITEAEEERARHEAAKKRSKAQLRELMAQGGLTTAAANLIGEEVEEHTASAAAAEKLLGNLQRQRAAIDQQPTGRDLEQRIKRKVAEFIAADLSDPLTRQKFNAWLLAVGVRITAVDPKRNRWDFTLDGVTRGDVTTYRNDRGVIVDDTIDQIRGLGFSEEAIKNRRQQIEKDLAGEAIDPADPSTWRWELGPEPEV